MRISEAIRKLDNIGATYGDIEIEGLQNIEIVQKQVKRIVGGIRVEYVAVPQPNQSSGSGTHQVFKRS